MKRFLLFTALILTSLFAFGQMNVTVNGNVSYTDGSPAENVSITIATDSFPSWGGYYNTLTTGSDGNYSDSFEVPDGLLQGNFWVYMADCNGTYQTETSWWGGPGDTDQVIDFVYCDVQQDSCGVFIQVDSTASGTQFGLTAMANNTAPYTYVWSTGETTQSIIVSNSGQYCVTITDATGCTASNCVTLTTPPACSAYIEHTPIGGLVAVANGEAPYTYMWSTGELTQSIIPSASGQYCVTITDNDGCTASECTYFQGGVDSCGVFIIEDQIGDLIASGNGNAPLLYVWNTGDTSSYISPSGPGLYCVTMTDATGCAATNCIQIESNEPDNYTITGLIFPEDSSSFVNLQGLVYLYELDQMGVPGPAIDSVPFSQAAAGNFYVFDTLNAGDYIVKAVVDPTTPESADYFPTYHWSSLFWEDADVITIPYSGNLYYNIILIETDGLQGDGEIGGFVSDGNEFTGSEVDDRSDDPLAGVTVILTTEADEPLLYVITGEDGLFSFQNLPWGTYKVYLEVIGQEKVFTIVTIGPDQPSVTDIHFEVSDDGVTSTESVLEYNDFTLAPNPVTNALNLNFTLKQSSEIQVLIQNANGQVLYQRATDRPEGNQTMNFDVDQLPSGLYFLNLNAGGQYWVKKFVKH